ncbi:hypothetical protein SK128_006543, partial [Halocaridina rubra]
MCPTHKYAPDMEKILSQKHLLEETFKPGTIRRVSRLHRHSFSIHVIKLSPCPVGARYPDSKPAPRT